MPCRRVSSTAHVIGRAFAIRLGAQAKGDVERRQWSRSLQSRAGETILAAHLDWYGGLLLTAHEPVGNGETECNHDSRAVWFYGQR